MLKLKKNEPIFQILDSILPNDTLKSLAFNLNQINILFNLTLKPINMQYKINLSTKRKQHFNSLRGNFNYF